MTSEKLHIDLSEGERRALVLGYVNSGLSRRVFCEERGIRASTFKNWHYRYGGSLRPSRTGKPLFKPVTVTDDVAGEGLGASSKSVVTPASVTPEPSCVHPHLSSGSHITIDYAGFCMKIPNGFEAATLQRILVTIHGLEHGC